MGRGYRRGDGTTLASAVLVAAAAVGLWMLRRPTSRLSQWVDREIDTAVHLPAVAR